MVLNEQGGPNHVGNFCSAPIIADTRLCTLEGALGKAHIITSVIFRALSAQAQNGSSPRLRWKSWRQPLFEMRMEESPWW